MQFYVTLHRALAMQLNQAPRKFWQSGWVWSGLVGVGRLEVGGFSGTGNQKKKKKKTLNAIECRSDVLSKIQVNVKIDWSFELSVATMITRGKKAKKKERKKGGR